MFTTHTGWLKFFNRRAKGKPFKAINRYLRLYENTDESFTISRRGGGGHGSDFARIGTDNTCTFLTSLNADDAQGKNLVRKALGFGYVYSCTSGRYGMYDHTLRFQNISANVPFTTGLKLDLVTGKILYSVPDVKKKTNRTKAKPVYEYTNKVLSMMELLARIDGFTDGAAPRRGGRWWENRDVLTDAEQLPMEDEKLAEVAELAYKEAAARTSPPSHRYLAGSVIVQRTEQETKAIYNEAVLRLAKQRLHATLKRRNNCYDKEVVN